jgi:O-antigen ligase
MTWANRTAFFLICACIVVSTLAYGAVHQPIIALIYLVITAIGMLWAIDSFKSGEIRVSRSLLQIPLIAAIAYGFFQVIPFGTLAESTGLQDIPRTISVFPFATAQASLHFIALLVFFAVLLVLLDSASRIRKLVILITVFGFAYAFFGIIQSVLSPDKIYGIYEIRYGSPFGSFVNRHNYAAFIEMALALPLGLIFVGAIASDKKLLFFTAIALMGVSLLLSGSRGGLVAFLAQLIFLVIMTVGTRNKKNFVLKAGLVVVLFAGIIAGSFFVGGETSLTRIAETAQSKDVTTDRAHIWSVTMNVIANHLPFGAGLGAFGVAYTPFDTYSGLERVEQAHNDYLQVIADAGLVGAVIGIAFLWLVFGTGRRSSKTKNTYRRGVAIGAFSGIFAIFVHSVFDFVLHTTAISLMFLTLLALLHAAGNDYPDDMEVGEFREQFRKRSSKAQIASFRR